MAKLPEPFCVRAVEIRGMLADGRERDALDMLIAALRAGTASKAMQAIAADLLTPKTRKRGAPKRLPMRWYEIGSLHAEFMSAGMTSTQAMLAVQQQIQASERHIQTCVATYNKAREEHDAPAEE